MEQVHLTSVLRPTQYFDSNISKRRYKKEELHSAVASWYFPCGYIPTQFRQCPLMHMFVINRNNASSNLRIVSRSPAPGANVLGVFCFAEKNFLCLLILILWGLVNNNFVAFYDFVEFDQSSPLPSLSASNSPSHYCSCCNIAVTSLHSAFPTSLHPA